MIIIAGRLTVPADRRAAFLSDALTVITAARAAPGCHDFHLCADPVDATRINIYEQWDTVADVEAFRGTGPSGEQQDAIIEADVHQHTVANSIRL